MSKFSAFVLIFVALGSVLAFENCGGVTPTTSSVNPASSAPTQISGTVQQLNMDGCNYVICSVDNTDNTTKCFIPQGMDPTLLNVGNVVTVNGYIRGDVLTSCMAGSVLQVTSASLVSGTTVPSTTTTTKTSP